MDDYRWIATSPEGFVQQVVCSYVRHGYYFFVSGRVPGGKDPCKVDAKLMETYGVRRGRNERYRRKKRGLANVHYIRHGGHWLLLCSKGEHELFEREAANIRDARKSPIHFEGYSIRLAKGLYRPHRCKTDREGPPERDDKLRVRVQIGRSTYRDMKGKFLDLAPKRNGGIIAAMFWNLPFEPYAPVRQQLLVLLNQVNKRRKIAGRKRVSPTVIRYKRRIVKPFELNDSELLSSVGR